MCGREGGVAVGSINMEKKCIEHFALDVNGFQETLEKARKANFGIMFVSAIIDLNHKNITKKKYFCKRLQFGERTSHVVTSFSTEIRGSTALYLEQPFEHPIFFLLFCQILSDSCLLVEWCTHYIMRPRLRRCLGNRYYYAGYCRIVRVSPDG